MSAHSSPARARRRADVWFALASALALALLAWVVITMQGLSHDLRTANDARDALARQVQTLGHKPVAGPPGSRGEPGQSITGQRGPKGDTGASGKPAPTLTPSPGASGASGAPGKPGSDSTVAGPTGPPGANSTVAGPTGPAGQNGRDGTNGTDGKNGQPPDGWTYTDPATGADMDCERVSDFDPDHPRYECRQTSTPSPSDTPPGKGLLGAVALLSTASYRKLGGGPHA